MPPRSVAVARTSPRRWSTRAEGAILAAVLLTGATAGAAGTVQGDLFRDERYRIQVTKPADWHFVPTEQASRRARQALPEGARGGGAVTATLLVVVSEAPPGVPARYPARVTVAVEALADEPGVQTLEGYAQASLGTLGTLVEDFRLKGVAKRVSVGGVAGRRVEYSARLAPSEGPVPIRGIALHFLRGKTGYAITAVTRAEEFAAHRETLEGVLASIRFLP